MNNVEEDDFRVIVTLWKLVHVSPDGKVPIEPFLTASKAVLMVVDACGSGFRVVKNDIAGNIKKLYRANQAMHSTTLQELIIAEDSEDGLATVALLWLKRAFQFIASFLLRLVTSEKSLEECVTEAYHCTLRPCHNSIIQKMFWAGVRLAPSREKFYKRMHPDEALVKSKIEEFLVALYEPLMSVVRFFKERGLEDTCQGDELYENGDPRKWFVHSTG
eukprot:jgi/Galph1/2969/GphlegSOOS_G1608.1